MNADRLKVSMIISLLAGVFHIATLQAATWTNGYWSVAANWTEGAVPAAGTAVTISPPVAGMTLTVDVESVSVSSLTFSGKSVTITGGTITMSGNMTASVAATINNDITTTAASPYLYCSGKVTMYGDFTGKSGATVTMGTTSGGSNGGADFRGSVTIPNGTIVFDKPGWKSPPFNFYGSVRVSTIKSSNYNNTTALFCSTGNEWTSLQNGYAKGHPNCEGALPATSTVKLLGTTYEKNPFLNLRNYSQTIDRILSDGLTNTSGTTEKGKAMTYSLRSYRSSASDATSTTLKLNASANNQNHVRVYDKITLIYNPQGDYTQTFATNFAHTTSGDIIVSNGTFRVAGTSSYKNVKRIVVADGATFDLATEAADALVGVTNIAVGAGARFAIAATAATPFTSQAVSLELDDGATFELPAGADWLFGKATVGGRLLDGGTYSGADAGGSVPQLTGTGQLTLPDVEMPTTEATWDGGGADDSIATAANWDDDATPALAAASLYPLFATGGTEALVDRALDFKGLHFGGSQTSFSIVSNSQSAALTLRQSGIAVDASHTATVDVPVTIKSDQAWSLARGATLRFKTPVGMSSPYAVTVVGSGETSGSAANERPTSSLRLDAPNGFGGSFAVSGAQVLVYSATNAFGPSSDAAVTLTDSRLALYGSTIERPISIGGTNNKYYWFASYAGGDGTNRMTKALTVSNCTYWRPRVENVLVTEDGVTVHCDVITTGGGTWIVRGKPWVHSNTSSSVSALELSGGAKMRFQVAGNVIRRLKMTSSSSQVHCEVDNPFSGTTTLFCGSSGSSLDLHGHEVSVSEFGSTSGGTVKSETRGMLVLNAQSGTITNGAVRFTGAAGFKMGGPGAVWFKTAMESTGGVSVTRGTLGFTQTGSWENCADVTVGGTGRLVVAKDKTFAKNAVFFFADSGVLQIPDGVTLRAGQMIVDGAPVRNGMYGSAASPAPNKSQAAHFAGGGTLLVGKLGTILSLR